MSETIKEKLLGLVGETDFNELSVTRLVDLLADKLKQKSSEIERLTSANAHERECLRGERENLRREYSQLRRDPARSWESAYPIYFRDNDGLLYEVVVRYEHVEMSQIASDRTRFKMQQVPPSEAKQP